MATFHGDSVPLGIDWGITTIFFVATGSHDWLFWLQTIINAFERLLNIYRMNVTETRDD